MLQAVEMLAFTTGMLSASAAVIHLVCIQILMHDSHLPACAPGDSRCAEGYNMIVVMYIPNPTPRQTPTMCSCRGEVLSLASPSRCLMVEALTTKP